MFVADAVAKGAKLRTGGERIGSEGYFFQPTVLTDLSSDARILNDARVKAAVVGDAPMFDIIFTEREVQDYRSSLGDEATMKRCNAFLRAQGVLKSESKYYISAVHTDADVRFTLDAFANAIAALRDAHAG